MNNDGDDYSFLLKHWIKLFLNLTNEDDFQIREITLTTFEQINKLVKSQLTPFLKQIVPHWLALTGDPNGNVSKIASQSFSSTFSKNKLNEVFLLYKKAIIDNVDTILFKTNYNEKNNETRLISGAFYSVIVLSKIAKDDKFINGELIKLLDKEQFWKYSKFNDQNVQSSWFNVINSLLLFKFDLIANYVSKINQATFNRLGDKNVTLQENIWQVLFTLMKLDEQNCFSQLSYDKVFKSFNELLKRNAFNQELLVSNFDLILKYFLNKNENKEEFINSLFNQFKKEILNKNEGQTLAINLYFQSLLFLIQNSELVSSNQKQANNLLNKLINEKLSSIIEQLSSDSKYSQEIFKRLVHFSSKLKSLNFNSEVQLINELILKSVKDKLERSNEEREFDLQSIKNLLNIIFNLKAYQLKKKLSLFLSSSIETLEFVKYKFEFYEQTDDLRTKKELLREILRIAFSLNQTKISSNFIEFLNYLVQFSTYLNVLDDRVVDDFITNFKIFNHQIHSLDESMDKKRLIIKLYYVIHQILLKSDLKIELNNQLNNSTNVFSFIFTLQIFKDEDKINLITEKIELIFDVLFKEFEISLAAKSGNRSLLDKLDENDEGELSDCSAKSKNDELIKRFIKLLTNESEFNLLNAIYSLLNLKLDNSIYEKIFSNLIKLNENDEIHILNYLILDYLNKNNKVLPVKTIECLIFNFIEFTCEKSIEKKNLWCDVLFKSLNKSIDHEKSSTDVIANLSAKFKQMLLNQKSITFEQLNLIITNIYTFVIKLSTLDEYSNATSLTNLIKSMLISEKEFEQFKSDLNVKVFEFLWIKNDLIEYDFPQSSSTSPLEDDLKIPHLIHASYASLRISKIFQFVNDKFESINEQNTLDQLISELTDEQIVTLLQNDTNLEYLFSYSNLSYCYLKILNQIYSYGMLPVNANDLIENYINFYEQIYTKLDENFVKKYAIKAYQLNYEDNWQVASLHHLLHIVGIDSVFELDSISKSLKINNFSLIMKYIPKQNLELFLEQAIQYNLVRKTNYPQNFNDIEEYLNIIAICLKNYLITIDYERNLNPIVNSLITYQEKIQAKEIDDQLYLKDEFDDSHLIDSITSVISFLESIN